MVDDFVVVGFGDTLEDAVRDHDHNLEAFLQRCVARGIRLNSNKVQLRRQEVPFIGHVATDKGLRADPTKVDAITRMPRPQMSLGSNDSWEWPSILGKVSSPPRRRNKTTERAHPQGR